MPNFSWFHRFGSPKYFYYKTRNLGKILATISIVLILFSWYQGLFIVPSDYQQQDAFRIIYVHVPAAFLSLAVYTYIAVLSLIYLVWRIKIADILAEASAGFGVGFTFIALITGAIWGKPMWGAWWVWDARLTSELLLLFIYFGYIGIRNAFGDRIIHGAKAAAVVGLLGFINIPIIHYSVTWWQTLHQGPSLSKFSSPDIALEMLIPLLISIAGFFSLFGFLLVTKARSIILWRERNNSWVQSLV